LPRHKTLKKWKAKKFKRAASKLRKSMDDSARISRLLALLAGNGFVVVKVNSLTEQGGITCKYFALSYLILSLIGLAGAYIAIARKPDTTWAVWGERIGMVVLAIFAIVWFVATALYDPDSKHLKHSKRVTSSYEFAVLA
jgi:anaerobic C4-dicarboxylate transporter